MVLDEAYLYTFFNKEVLPPAYGAKAFPGELIPSYGLPYLGDDVVLQAPVITALYYEDPDAPGIGTLYYEVPEAPTINVIKFEFNTAEEE